MLKLTLIEFPVVEGGEARRQALESANQQVLSSDDLHDQMEPRLPGKFDPVLGFRSYVIEPDTDYKQVRDQVVAAVRRKSKVSRRFPVRC